jgi:hypothetical protein
VFTARYPLSPYIKQIRFVFKGLSRPAYMLIGFVLLISVVAQSHPAVLWYVPVSTAVADFNTVET